jgi:hypothetical protein
LRECDYSKSPETAHFFERAWQYIFAFVVKKVDAVPVVDVEVRREFAKRVLLCQIDTRKCDVDPWNLVYPDKLIRGHGEIKGKFVEANPKINACFSDLVVNNPYAPNRPVKIRQFDHRKLPYWSITSMVNKLKLAESCVGYEYITRERPVGLACAWVKPVALAEMLPYKADEFDVIVVIDTDAWVRDVDALIDWCHHLYNSDYSLMFGAETTNDESTSLANVQQHVNTGCMIMKNSEKVQRYFEEVVQLPQKYAAILGEFRTKWSWEQICLNYKLEHDKDFAADVVIAPMDKFNTPAGSVVRHCWIKDMLVPLVLQELLEHVQQQK